MATIIEALEELYPLQAEHKHFDFGSRWQQFIDRSISRIRIESDNMAQVQRDTIQEWNNGSTTNGPIPHSMNTRVLTALAHSFTHRNNPSGNRNSNIAFQRDLDERLEADGEYQANPSLHRLCYLVSELIHHWEKLEMQSRRMSGSKSDKGKISNISLSRIADFGHIQISMNEASGTVVWLTVDFDVDRRTKKRSNSLDGTILPRKAPDAAVPE